MVSTLDRNARHGVRFPLWGQYFPFSSSATTKLVPLYTYSDVYFNVNEILIATVCL